MTDLRAVIAEYLSVRRSLGYKLKWDGLLLAEFADFCEREGAATVTTDVALAWAKAPAGCSPSWWANRLTVVRVFAKYLRAIDPSAEVPPVGLIRDHNRRATPFLYSERDVYLLMAATNGLSNPLVAATFETLIGLLSVTGLRVGEAIRMDRADVCWQQGLLRIKSSKFNKSREVPLHASCVERLRSYANRRDLECLAPTSASFFVSALGHRLHYPSVQQTFAKLVRQVGLEPRSERCRPRIHDLRHTFAVRTLLGWQKAAGVAVEPRLPLLSTYLGHSGPQATYWYLSATPQLFTLVGKRLEESMGELP